MIVSNNIIVRESEKISIKKVNIQKRVFTFLFTNIFSKKSRQNSYGVVNKKKTHSKQEELR
ncbi:hypothetical protein EfmAA290_29230 (plasmid) [Enterococcus faecium]|nr:hypothetical protein EfmAA290_29230 [Enterococcus faecium]